jgi:hypothetical protein
LVNTKTVVIFEIKVERMADVDENEKPKADGEEEEEKPWTHYF